MNVPDTDWGKVMLHVADEIPAEATTGTAAQVENTVEEGDDENEIVPVGAAPVYGGVTVAVKVRFCADTLCGTDDMRLTAGVAWPTVKGVVWVTAVKLLSPE
jgi:hypothetical protein